MNLQGLQQESLDDLGEGGRRFEVQHVSGLFDVNTLRVGPLQAGRIGDLVEWGAALDVEPWYASVANVVPDKLTAEDHTSGLLGANPHYLARLGLVAKASQAGIAHVSIRGPLDPIRYDLFEPVGAGEVDDNRSHWTAVIMPMRIGPNAETKPSPKRKRKRKARRGAWLVTLEQCEQMDREMSGVCRNCGTWRGTCEPDAEHYPCDECGLNEVYGCHWYAVNGWVL